MGFRTSLVECNGKESIGIIYDFMSMLLQYCAGEHNFRCACEKELVVCRLLRGRICVSDLFGLLKKGILEI